MIYELGSDGNFPHATDSTGGGGKCQGVVAYSVISKISNASHRMYHLIDTLLEGILVFSVRWVFMLLLNCTCRVCMSILMYSSLFLRPVDKVLVIMDGIILLVEYQVYVSFQSGRFVEVVFVECYV